MKGSSRAEPSRNECLGRVSHVAVVWRAEAFAGAWKPLHSATAAIVSRIAKSQSRNFWIAARPQHTPWIEPREQPPAPPLQHQVTRVAGGGNLDAHFRACQLLDEVHRIVDILKIRTVLMMAEALTS